MPTTLEGGAPHLPVPGGSLRPAPSSAPRSLGSAPPVAPAGAVASAANATRSDTIDVLVVELDAWRVGLLAAAIVELSPVVASTPLPGTPPFVDGVIDWRGRAIPAVDLGIRFGRPPRPVHLSDHLVIAKTSGRHVALRVNRASELVTVHRSDLESATGLTPALQVVGLVRLATGMVVVHDLDAFLSVDEAALLDRALDALRAARETSPAPLSSAAPTETGSTDG